MSKTCVVYFPKNIYSDSVRGVFFKLFVTLVLSTFIYKYYTYVVFIFCISACNVYKQMCKNASGADAVKSKNTPLQAHH